MQHVIFQLTTGVGIIALAIIGLLLYVYIYDGIDRRIRILESNQSSVCTAVSTHSNTIADEYS